jgi:hypothetical protein
METVQEIIKNEQTRTLSESRRTSTTSIPREQHVALFALINKVRMLNGWTTKTAQELDATIRTWAEVLNRYRIPLEYYNECYLRAVDTRQKKLQDGKEIEIDAPLLVAAWQSGLAQEIEQRRIAEKRYLPDTAESDCPRCFGSGMECTPKGAKPCDHRPLEDGEVIEQPYKAPSTLTKHETRERPKPKTAIGILLQAKLNGGDDEKLSRAIAYLRREKQAWMT